MERRANDVEQRIARAVRAHKELVDAHGRDAAVLRAIAALFVVFALVESQAPSWGARLFFLGVFLAAVCAFFSGLCGVVRALALTLFRLDGQPQQRAGGLG